MPCSFDIVGSCHGEEGDVINTKSTEFTNTTGTVLFIKSRTAPPLFAGVGGGKGSSSILDAPVNKSQKRIFLLENILSPWNCWMLSAFGLHSLELDLAIQFTAIFWGHVALMVCTVTSILKKKSMQHYWNTAAAGRKGNSMQQNKRRDRYPFSCKGFILLYNCLE